MIIAFASSKGGVGKSTTCAAIGARLAQRGEVVLILDLDQNRTLERWGRKAKINALTVQALERDQFTTIFREVVAAGWADHILIDLAGSREATVLKAIARSDLVVIPAQASEPDLREALVVVSDIKDVAEEKGATIPYRLLLTKMPSLRTRVTDFAYQELARHGLPVFRTTMVERVAYKEMFLTGTPPEPTSGAGVEVAAARTEMEEIIKAALSKRSRARRPHREADMATPRPRPAFQSVELDPIDARLEAKAAEKGIPTLVNPKAEEHPSVSWRSRRGYPLIPRKTTPSAPKQATPRSRMKGLKIELPDLRRAALKKRAAEDMVSLKHIIMTALRDKGIPINDADMFEDGRRFR